MNFINSKSVLMYPSSKRTDVHDVDARLLTEYNLTSLINRLTGRKCFIIEGLDVSGTTVSPGKCNIDGYLFTIKAAVTAPSASANTYLCFKILTEKTDESSYVLYDELVNLDDETAASLDGSTATNSKFYGLSLETVDVGILNNADGTTKEFIDSSTGNGRNWYLPIAIAKDKTWVAINPNDGMDTNTIIPSLRYNTKDIQIVANKEDLVGDYYKNPQDLCTWLEYNSVIDDGRIE